MLLIAILPDKHATRNATGTIDEIMNVKIILFWICICKLEFVAFPSNKFSNELCNLL